MKMGATYCNLYFHGDDVNIPEGKIQGKSRLLGGFDGWTILLCEDNNWRKITRLTRFFPGDALAFFCFDDELFELMFYRDGKKIASIDNSGTSSKLKDAGEMFPEDPTVLKKLRMMKWCTSVDESFRLLEETFGLPFDVVYEQEEIEKVKKSDETWKTLKAREKEFRNRPNRFELEMLPPEQWPESVRNQDKQSPYRLRLSPDYHEITCVDPEGRTLWTFAPGLNGMREQLQFVQADLDEAVIQVRFHDENRDRNDKVCRLAAADGAMLTEYVLPDSAKKAYAFYWNPYMGCYVYSMREQMVIMDRELKEIRRFKTDPKASYFYFFREQYGYTQYKRHGDENDLFRIDLNSGEQKRIELEIPVYLESVCLPGEIFCGVTFRGTIVDKLVFFDGNGRVISRNGIENGPEDYPMQIWGEDGKIYIKTKKWYGPDPIKIYLVRDTAEQK